MKIFIDDERYPIGDDWIICRNLKEFINVVLTTGFPDHISFDHDLGEDEPTGLDITKWIIEYDMENDVINEKFSYYVHSQNPIGKENIEKLIKNYIIFKFSYLHS